MISIQSQDYYAPQENDLNIIMAANLNFQISDDENDSCCLENDEANCSQDFLINHSDTGLNESGSIDELYQQIKCNSNWKRKGEEDDEGLINENSASEISCRSYQNFHHHDDRLNDN